MSSDVWIGALLSIPIGIATGLAIDPVKKFWGDRGKAKAEVQRQDIKDRYVATLFYRMHPHLMTQYLAHSILLATFVGAAMSIFVGTMLLLPQFIRVVPIREPYAWFIIIGTQLLTQLVTVISSVVIVKYCRPALRMWRNVRFFNDFVEAVPKEMRNFDAEERAEQIQHSGFYDAHVHILQDDDVE